MAIAQRPDIEVGNWQATGLLADLDTIGDITTEGIRRPGCFLRRVANQSIATATPTDLSWDAETLDTDAMWSAGTTVTINEDGLWLILAQVSWPSNATGYRRIFLYTQENGGSFSPIAADTRNACTSTTTHSKLVHVVDLRLSTASKFIVNVHHTAGVSLNVTASVAAMYLSAGVIG